jgi:hypothetical protein
MEVNSTRQGSLSSVCSTKRRAWLKRTADRHWTPLKNWLRATEDRIAELEAEAEAYRDRAERAEQWLHKVYTEIDDLFSRQKR